MSAIKQSIDLSLDQIESQLHQSVLLDESISALNINENGIYLDATFGRGGHSQAILKRLHAEKGKLIVVDRDPDAFDYFLKYFSQKKNIHFELNQMSHLQKIAEKNNIFGKIDGILMDLGVSSPQLDNAERGFSFAKNGPLDMRMNNQKGISAKDWVNSATVKEMVYTFSTYGEEKFALKIAYAIEKRRSEKIITETLELAEIISNTIPKSISRKEKKHPATRCFQAIRMEINQELQELKLSLNGALESLAIGGRLAVISFHSLEDRIVKQFMKQYAFPEDILPDLPIPIYNNEVRFKLIGKPQKASLLEIDKNPRSRSAILRVAEKIK